MLAGTTVCWALRLRECLTLFSVGLCHIRDREDVVDVATYCRLEDSVLEPRWSKKCGLLCTHSERLWSPPILL